MKIHFVSTEHPHAVIALASMAEGHDRVPPVVRHRDAQALPSHPKKKEEFLAVRRLAEVCCDTLQTPYRGIRKDVNGKPHLVDSSFHLSLSHSYPMVACVVHATRACGIDVERPRASLLKLKHKFLNAREVEACGEDVEKLCLYWSAKETLYKIYGSQPLSFVEQLSISSVSDHLLRGEMTLDGVAHLYDLHFAQYGGYFLVYHV